MPLADSSRFNDQPGDASRKAFGEALREVREATGATMRRLAHGTAYSPSHLRSVENGNRRATPDLVEACDDALRAGGILIALFHAEEADDQVRRRTILATLGTLAAVGMPNPRLICEALRSDLLSVLGVSDWNEISAEYGQLFVTESPDDFQVRLTGDLLVLRSTLSTGSDQAEHAAPRLMMLQGMVTANLGDRDAASRWYRAARLAADASHDGTVRQWIQGREVFRRGYEGAPPERVLAEAADVDDVEARLASAQALARLQETARAYAALVEARRLHEVCDQSEDTIYAMPHWRMALSAAHVYALAGDVTRCEDELALVAPPAVVQRWEAQADMQRAVAYGKSGDRSTAAQIVESIVNSGNFDERSVILTEMRKDALPYA
jgi:transcriptional regulator with XRE-family HTH domain